MLIEGNGASKRLVRRAVRKVQKETQVKPSQLRAQILQSMKMKFHLE